MYIVRRDNIQRLEIPTMEYEADTYIEAKIKCIESFMLEPSSIYSFFVQDARVYGDVMFEVRSI